MRGLKAVRYLVLVLAASVLAVGALAACGGGSGGDAGGGGIGVAGGPSGNAAGSPSGNAAGSPSGNAAGSPSGNAAGGGSGDPVTGTVKWPDGNPAAGASVYFNNHDAGFSGSGWSQGQNGNWYETQQVPADGSYSLSGCPCADLTAYLYVPASVMSPANGGWDCWIIMQDDNQNYSGLQANPGDDINWQALDLPCSRTFYTSDQATVQSEATTVLPSINGGPWQTAEQLTSGGSGG